MWCEVCVRVCVWCVCVCVCVCADRGALGEGLRLFLCGVCMCVWCVCVCVSICKHTYFDLSVS